jgi:hypothetical protein
MSKKRTSKPTYEEIIATGVASLAENEFWVINHADGPLWDTASKRLDTPVVVFCNAMDCNWDEAMESGFWLDRLERVRAKEGTER